MDQRKLLNATHRHQSMIFRTFQSEVHRQKFVYRGTDPRVALGEKLIFLRRLKRCLERAFRFNDYQAEFVKNEAMKRVLRKTPERVLTYPNTKKAEKLVRASFILGNHYFRFIFTMFLN